MRKALLLFLCCLPALADSITFDGFSSYPEIANVSASGVDSLNVSKTQPSSYYPDTSIAGLGATVNITQANGAYRVQGDVIAYQGFDYSAVQSTGASLAIMVDLPSTFGNLSVSGYDYTVDNDVFHADHPRTCNINVFSDGNASGALSCNAPYYMGSPELSLTFTHTAGKPLSLGFSFSDSVTSPNSTYSEDFDFRLSSPTPEPGTFMLVVGGLLATSLFLVRYNFTENPEEHG